MGCSTVFYNTTCRHASRLGTIPYKFNVGYFTTPASHVGIRRNIPGQILWFVNIYTVPNRSNHGRRRRRGYWAPWWTDLRDKHISVIVWSWRILGLLGFVSIQAVIDWLSIYAEPFFWPLSLAPSTWPMHRNMVMLLIDSPLTKEAKRLYMIFLEGMVIFRCIGAIQVNKYRKI
jgi:hypothetical protein